MTNPSRVSWLNDPRLRLEAFVTINLAFLAVDICLAHSVNDFRHAAEYAPLYFSLAAPLVLVFAIVLRERWGFVDVWRDLGYLTGWAAIALGLCGVVLHLDSRFFYERTIKSLVYAAPFAAPLAYTGLGLLLVMNRMVEAGTKEWSLWVVLMALGGFAGNFVFSLTDHAQNDFFHWTEWIPVASSALAVGFLMSIYLSPVTKSFLRLCAAVLAVQALVGVLGFCLHARANWHGPAVNWFENLVHGAPPLAPLLFPNLVLLCLIGLWELRHFVRDGDSIEISLQSAGAKRPSEG
jgi:hypothetical protein